MKEASEAKRYHVPNNAAAWYLDGVQPVSDEELEKWAHDPNCIEMEVCAKALAERSARREKDAADKRAAMEAEIQRRSEVRKELADNPFNPRTEVSADAIHIASRIVKHLWIIFVLLPFVAALLWAILAALK
jgi:hypothetical protein